MISSSNQPLNAASSDADFTIEHYRLLLELAKANYRIASYDDVPWGQRFVLWRHDVDYSLNRSLALARLESAVGVRATYFINPHCEFYNLAELSQARIVQEILSLGHGIGLHFDAAFYGIEDEASLHAHISAEAGMLEGLLGVRPKVFSFHNPVAAHLSCDDHSYGGLINCYSQRFKSEVAYCSDSNGYWRFRRLFDVLSSATDACLQVLTHPGWWQEQPMPPRQRIFRSAYGRARATMLQYDATLKNHGRLNHAGLIDAIDFLRDRYPERFELLDYLFNQGALDSLFLEMWRLHELQISRLCAAQLAAIWQVAQSEIAALLSGGGSHIEGRHLFALVFERSWCGISACDERTHGRWRVLQSQLAFGRGTLHPDELHAGCLYLAGAIGATASWGRGQPFCYDGLGVWSGRSSGNMPNIFVERWQRLKQEIERASERGLQ